MELSACFRLGKALRQGDADAFFETYDSLLQVHSFEITEKQLEALKEVARQIAELPQDDFSMLHTAAHTPAQGSLLIDVSSTESVLLSTQLRALVEKQKQEVSCSDSGAVSDFESCVSLCDGDARSRSNSMVGEDNVQPVASDGEAVFVASCLTLEQLELSYVSQDDTTDADAEMACKGQAVVVAVNNKSEEVQHSDDHHIELPIFQCGEKLLFPCKAQSEDSKCDLAQILSSNSDLTNDQATPAQSSESQPTYDQDALMAQYISDEIEDELMRETEWSVVRSRRKNSPQPHSQHNERSMIRRGSPIQTRTHYRDRHQDSPPYRNHMHSEKRSQSRIFNDSQHRHYSRRRRHYSDHRKPFKSQSENSKSYHSCANPKTVLAHPPHQTTQNSPSEQHEVSEVSVQYQEPADTSHPNTSTKEDTLHPDKSAMTPSTFNYDEVVKFLWKGWTLAQQEMKKNI